MLASARKSAACPQVDASIDPYRSAESGYFFSIAFTNPQPSLAQYSCPYFLNRVLPHWGHFSGTGSSHVI